MHKMGWDSGRRRDEQHVLPNGPEDAFSAAASLKKTARRVESGKARFFIVVVPVKYLITYYLRVISESKT